MWHFDMGNDFQVPLETEAKNGQEDVDKAGTYLMQLNDMKSMVNWRSRMKESLNR